MKPAATLKELLKPPFKWLYNNIMSGDEEILSMGNSDMWLTDKFYRAFKHFVVQALNEKWERDFGEPMRWIVERLETIDGDFFYSKCPKCNEYSPVFTPNYCPSCGQRLFPPEEAHGE